MRDLPAISVFAAAALAVAPVAGCSPDDQLGPASIEVRDDGAAAETIVAQGFSSFNASAFGDRGVLFYVEGARADLRSVVLELDVPTGLIAGAEAHARYVEYQNGAAVFDSTEHTGTIRLAQAPDRQGGAAVGFALTFNDGVQSRAVTGTVATGRVSAARVAQAPTTSPTYTYGYVDVWIEIDVVLEPEPYGGSGGGCEGDTTTDPTTTSSGCEGDTTTSSGGCEGDTTTGTSSSGGCEGDTSTGTSSSSGCSGDSTGTSSSSGSCEGDGYARSAMRAPPTSTPRRAWAQLFPWGIAIAGTRLMRRSAPSRRR